MPPEWQDRNGHVNVQYYQTLYEDGGWQILENMGVNEQYLAQFGCSFFDLEHHLRYFAEIHVGETVSVYNRMLGRDNKLFHGMSFIVNDTHDTLACTLEYLSVCIDLDTRRSMIFPEDMAMRFDKTLTIHNALTWSSPKCGAMQTKPLS